MFYTYVTNRKMHVFVYFETHNSTLYLEFFVRECSREVWNLNPQGKMTDQLYIYNTRLLEMENFHVLVPYFEICVDD